MTTESEHLHEHHNSQGEAPPPYELEHLKWGHAAIHKFPDIAKKYSKQLGTGALLIGAGWIIGRAALEIYKRHHTAQSDEEAFNGLEREHIEAAELEGKTRKNTTKPSPNEQKTHRSRFLH